MDVGMDVVGAVLVALWQALVVVCNVVGVLSVVACGGCLLACVGGFVWGLLFEDLLGRRRERAAAVTRAVEREALSSLPPTPRPRPAPIGVALPAPVPVVPVPVTRSEPRRRLRMVTASGERIVLEQLVPVPHIILPRRALN